MEISLPDAINLKFAGENIADDTYIRILWVFSYKAVVWERITKVIAFISSLTILMDIIGEDKIKVQILETKEEFEENTRIKSFKELLGYENKGQLIAIIIGTILSFIIIFSTIIYLGRYNWFESLSLIDKYIYLYSSFITVNNVILLIISTVFMLIVTMIFFGIYIILNIIFKLIGFGYFKGNDITNIYFYEKHNKTIVKKVYNLILIIIGIITLPFMLIVSIPCIIFCIYFGAPLVLGTYIFFKLQKYYKNIGLYLFSSLYYDLKKIVSRIAFLLIILSFALDFLLS